MLRRTLEILLSNTPIAQKRNRRRWNEEACTVSRWPHQGDGPEAALTTPCVQVPGTHPHWLEKSSPSFNLEAVVLDVLATAALSVHG